MNSLYQDVVVGGGKHDQKKEVKKHNGAKDPNSHAEIEARSDRLTDEPYVKQSELLQGDTKEEAQKIEKDDPDEITPQQELQKLANRSDKTLFEAKALFPFDIFPDTITIDANKVDIIIKTFIATETATSVMLKEIMDVRVESTLFVSKLIIDYGPHPLKISTVYVENLRKKDALKAKEIIEGILLLYRSENARSNQKSWQH
jgi:hypothetical protein